MRGGGIMSDKAGNLSKSGESFLSWLKDHWLQLIEATSAAVVAAVAVYGLFFTVIPLYSKAVLEEEKAKLEIEVKGVKASLAGLKKENESLFIERASLVAQVEKLKKEADDLEKQARTREAEIARATQNSLALVDKAAYDAMTPEFAAVKATASIRSKSSRKVARDGLSRAIKAGRASGKPVAYNPAAIKRRGRAKLGLRPRSSG